MKVVIATPLYPPEIGGPATYAEVLVRELPKKGIEVDLVKFSDVRYLPKLVRHFVYYKKLVKAAEQADAILALDPHSVGLPAMKAAQKVKKPLVVKIVGDYAWEQGVQRFGVRASLDAFVKTKRVLLPVRILQAIQTRVALRATRVIVPSEYLKYIVSTWGILDTKINVIHNAVPMSPPGVLPSAIAALPHPLVVSVGRFVAWKGFQGLIEAVSILREREPHTSLALIGDGPDREDLKEYAHEQLGLHGMYIGKLPHDETLATIKNADAFVLNSSYEGLSHTLIEAITLGVPIVATRAGGNTEIIEHEKNGLLVPVGASEQLAGALHRLVTDKGLAVELGKAAKESAMRFNEEEMIDATVRLLSSV